MAVFSELATLLVGVTAGAALVLTAQRFLQRRTESKSPHLERLLNGDKTISAEECIRWALQEFGNQLVMSTSFGMQSAVLLHMATRIDPNLKIIWIDTGYLHKETYLFAKHLAKRLHLTNLRVYQSDVSPARMEALHGQLWKNDDSVSHRIYGALRKVEPMNRALQELGAKALLSGVRSDQTDHRKTLNRIVYRDKHPQHYRIHPLLYWSQDDVDAYIAKHNLPYHPLKRKGYVSIGDHHSTTPKTKSSSDRATRFNGKQQECGLHTEKADHAELDRLLQKSVVTSSSYDRFLDEDTKEDPDLRETHGTNVGFEIYGREGCRFCEAARRVLDARSLAYSWCTMQRFDQITGKLEPEKVDGITVVARATVEARVDHVAPGSPPIETVPQIFVDGDYVGGFAELCVHLNVPKSVMDVALLKIGHNQTTSFGWAHTWNATPSLRQGPNTVRGLFDTPSPEEGSSPRASQGG